MTTRDVQGEGTRPCDWRPFPTIYVQMYICLPQLGTVLCCVCFANFLMIASGSLIINMCFKISWGDRWDAGVEVGSVRSARIFGLEFWLNPNP